MDAGRLTELIEGSDLDGLIRFVDALCSARDWDGLDQLVERCREAVHRGKQVFAAAEFAEYRIALEAPPAHAGPVVSEAAGRYGLGPLWEVAASTHTWADLEPHLAPGPARAMAAHERVMRGEDLSDVVIDLVLELPLVLQPWEPSYPTATYRSDKVDSPQSDLTPLGAVDPAEPGEEVDDIAGTDALRQLVLPWVDQSNGASVEVAVAGSALGAAAAIEEVSGWVAMPAQEALSYMAWTGASGGAHGRRRGSPVGRYDAWWVVAQLGGLDGLDDPSAVGEALERLSWNRWAPAKLAPGWHCHLAVEDAAAGRAWALAATDFVDDGATTLGSQGSAE